MSLRDRENRRGGRGPLQREVRRHASLPLAGRVKMQGRPITDEPDVPERIDEPALSMETPRRGVIPDLVPTSVRPRVHRTRDEGVGIVAKHLDTRGRDAELHRALPAIVCRLPDEE